MTRFLKAGEKVIVVEGCVVVELIGRIGTLTENVNWNPDGWHSASHCVQIAFENDTFPTRGLYHRSFKPYYSWRKI